MAVWRGSASAMIHLDTSALVDALVAPAGSAHRFRRLVDEGQGLAISSIVLFEWLRGPRTADELFAQTTVFGDASIVSFGRAEARQAARLYRSVRRPRGREADLAIAACAIAHGAKLWTLTPKDFSDLPGLRLY
jgi:predicted nucleic acid-binding protein